MHELNKDFYEEQQSLLIVGLSIRRSDNKQPSCH